MFPITAVRIHIKSNKLMYIGVFLLYLLGFIVGSLYSNVINQTDFSNSLVSVGDFIKNISASPDALNFNNLIIPNISPTATIFLSGLFLLGLPLVLFFVFKAGFSDGFFIAFLIKAFALKGFFLGMFFIALNLFFMLPALEIMSVSSIDLNRYIWTSIDRRAGTQRNIKAALIGYALVFIAAGFLIVLSTNLEIILLPKMVGYFFR